MKMHEKKSLQVIRTKLALKRVDPRRFYGVDDGAYYWIGDRAELNARDAAGLAAIHRFSTRPDYGTPEALRDGGGEYSDICGRVGCIAATHGSAGIVNFDHLPESWRDGSALGPIKPL